MRAASPTLENYREWFASDPVLLVAKATLTEAEKDLRKYESEGLSERQLGEQRFFVGDLADMAKEQEQRVERDMRAYERANAQGSLL